MNQRQKLFLPIYIVVWLAAAGAAWSLVRVWHLAQAEELHPWASFWVGSDLVLVHVMLVAAFGVLSLEVLCRLLTGKSLF